MVVVTGKTGFVPPIKNNLALSIKRPRQEVNMKMTVQYMSDLARWAEEHKDEIPPFLPVNEPGMNHDEVAELIKRVIMGHIEQEKMK